MNKIIALIVVIALAVLCLAACGAKEEEMLTTLEDTVTSAFEEATTLDEKLSEEFTGSHQQEEKETETTQELS